MSDGWEWTVRAIQVSPVHRFALRRGARATTGRAVVCPDWRKRVVFALEHDAEVMSNTQMNEALVGQPPEVQQEIIRINTIARPRALQVALLVPLFAGFIGLMIGFRMMRLPDPVASSAADNLIGG